MSEDRLIRLQRLTEMAWQARQADLARLQAREAALAGQIERLRQALLDRPGQIDPANDPAFAAGADLHWQGWVARERTRLNGELARLRAARAKLTQEVARDFGRNEVMKKLCRDGPKR